MDAVVIDAKRIEIQEKWVEKLTNEGYTNVRIEIRDSSLYGLDIESVMLHYDTNIYWPPIQNSSPNNPILKNTAAWEYDVRTKIFNEFFNILTNQTR